MGFDGLASRLAEVRERIADVQARAGLADPVRIIAVTKGHSVEAVPAAAAVGLTDVGENRIQEALRKQEEAGAVDVRWHMIGHLQSNKARDVPGRFALVHSVDSVKLGAALARAARRQDATGPQPVLAQVNVAGEAQKSGCPPEELEALLDALHGHPELAVRGLMTMAPLTDDERVLRQVFGTLRELRDRYRTRDRTLDELSMGMSGDYLAAVAEGATMVRLGTVLMGERPR
jgi:pyridoxal phosphate enzyme (YggS family)